MWVISIRGFPNRLLMGILLLFCILCTRTVAQPLEIDSAEIEEFLPKLPPKLKSKPNEPDSTIFGELELVHGPLETRWNGVPVVLVFFKVPVSTATRTLSHAKGPKDTVSFYMDHDSYACVRGYAFMPAGKKGKYKPVYIGEMGPNGGDPEIQSVFFANGDRDKQKELLVLYSCDFNHRALGLSGTHYSVLVFDDFDHAGKDGLSEMLELEEKISAGSASEEPEEGQSAIYGYTSAGEVKKRLKQLGY